MYMISPLKVEEEKRIVDNIIKDVRNLFRLRNENEAIKGKIISDVRNLFGLENEEEDYYKPVIVGNFLRNNYIEHESNGDRNKTLLNEEYLNKIRPY